MTPLARSMAMYREHGWLVEKVEHRNFLKQLKDLYGIADAIAVKPLGLDAEGKQTGGVVFIQATHNREGVREGFGSHINKMLASPNYPIIRKAGIRIVICAWKKQKTKDSNRQIWQCETVEMK